MDAIKLARASSRPEPANEASATFDERLQQGAYVSIILIGIVTGLCALSVARPFAVPVAAALIVGLTISRPAEWINRAPNIGAELREKVQTLGRPVAALQGLAAALNSLGGQKGFAVDVDQSGNFLQSVLLFLTPAMSEIVLFFGALLFFLLGRARMKGQFVLAFVERSDRLLALRIIADIERDLTTYVATATVINFAVGLCVGAMMWAIGAPSAILWGALAMMLNYLPYIGPAAMTAILLVMGLIVFPTLGMGLAPAGLFLMLTTIEGQFLSPTIMGRRLELNPLAVFLGIAFWTWLWGPIGAFLSVPMLVIAMAVWRNLFPADVSANA
jgi:predicted PurR-regulated permease PerM